MIVELYADTSNFIAQTTTGSDGKYRFADLPSGWYYVRFLNPDTSWYSFTQADVGSDIVDSDASNTGGLQAYADSPSFFLQAGEKITHIDAGMFAGTSFLPKEVTFTKLTDKKKIIISDDQTKTFDKEQWLDNAPNGKPDGTPEKQDPILFVRNKEVTIERVLLTPQTPTSLDPVHYKLRGTIKFAGTADVVVTSSGTGSLEGTDWKFTDLRSGNDKYAVIGYDKAMSIHWELITVTELRNFDGGTSINPGYLSYKEVSDNAPASYKLVRTLVHLGSAPQGVANPNSDKEVLDRVWEKFAERKVKTWDNQKMVYYEEWKWTSTPSTTLELIKLRTGNCVAFTRMLIDALRAQGIEQENDFVAIRPVGSPQIPLLMFLGKWKDTGGQNPGIQLPFTNSSASKFIRVNVVNDPEQLFWEKKNNKWDYTFDPAKSTVLKDEPDNLDGQNNENPIAVFKDHLMFRYVVDGKENLYDPSYGIIHDHQDGTLLSTLRKWEDEYISYYGLAFNANEQNAVLDNTANGWNANLNAQGA